MEVTKGKVHLMVLLFISPDLLQFIFSCVPSQLESQYFSWLIGSKPGSSISFHFSQISLNDSTSVNFWRAHLTKSSQKSQVSLDDNTSIDFLRAHLTVLPFMWPKPTYLTVCTSVEVGTARGVGEMPGLHFQRCQVEPSCLCRWT